MFYLVLYFTDTLSKTLLYKDSWKVNATYFFDVLNHQE